MTNRVLTIITLLLSFSNLYAQDIELLWSKSIDAKHGNAIAVDASGNVYVTGSGFVQKLDKNGELIWEKTEGVEISYCLDVDSEENVYLIGKSFQKNDLWKIDKEGNIFTDFGEIEDASDYYYDADYDKRANNYGHRYDYALDIDSDNHIYIAGIKVDQNGNIVSESTNNTTTWGEGVRKQIYSFALALDNQKNSYVTGVILSYSFGGSFVIKYDSQMNQKWIKRTEGSAFGRAIAVDSKGNIYAVGDFVGELDFDPNSETTIIKSEGESDIFLQKFDNDGNLIWVKSIGGAKYEGPRAMSIDNQDNLYLTGRFAGTVDFDPNEGTQYLTSQGNNDIFLQKMDSDGNSIWVTSLGGSGNDVGVYLDVDNQGNIYVTGKYSNTVDFDPNSGESILSSKRDEGINVFVAKYKDNTFSNKVDVNFKITDIDTGNPIDGVDIILSSNNRNEVIRRRIENDSKILIEVRNTDSYEISISKDGYFFYVDSIITNENDTTSIEKNVGLTSLKEGNNVQLYGITFEKASAELKSDAYPELDRIVTLLEENPTLVLEIAGHTDDVGTEQVNLILSENRAKSVVNYLSVKGISQERLQGKGYGESTPLVPNNSEENKAKNRRIELKVVVI